MNVKNVNFKKIASIVLAVTLVLSIIAPVPAAAAELKQAAEAELSVEQKLEEQKPEEQQPEEQQPEEQKPEEQKPEEEKPEEQKPEEEKPEEQKPEEQQPEEEKPEEQQPETEEPKRIEAGAMQADAERNALDENGGFYFTMDKNDIPLNEDVDENGNSLAWNNTFAPTADDCIVVIRGEEEIRVGIPENAVLVKYSETGYYLKTASGEEKLLADALKPGDVIVIRGDFTNGNTTFTVAESLIFVGEDGSLTIEAVPESRVMTLANGTVVDLNTGSITTSAGNITIDAAGQKIGITFATDANDAPSGWNDAGMYKPTDANCIQIIRGGRTYSVANTGTYYIVKNTDNEYYLKTESWMLGEAGALQEGDVIVISGQFISVDGATTLKLGTGYIKVGADSATFSTEDPNASTEPSTVDAGTISAGNGGYNVGTSGNKDGIYFTMAENSAPSGWTEAGFYIPAESTCIKLIRGGKTYDVANTGTYYIVKSSATEYYLKTEAWMLGGQGALQEGDILVIEGKFTSQDGKTVLNMGTSYVTIGADSATFTQDDPTAPTGPSTVDAGTINAGNGRYNVGAGGNKDGIYFTMAENSAPSGWNEAGFYVPAESTCIKLIRGGKTYEIANTGTYYIVKSSATEYYLKTEAWMLGGQGALQEGDILVVEGKFTSQDGKTILNMGTSYISVGTNTADFSTTMPEPAPEPTIVNAGAMQADSRGKSSEGLYFKLSANDAPFNPDWTESYTPASVDCIKLIRDGRTYSIGNIAAGTIIKYSETEYYLKTEKWMMSDFYPIRDGDILLVEGNFLDAKGETALSFSSNYISMEYGSATFSETYPDGSAFNKVETGMMGEDSWKDVTNGVSFTLADNQAPGNPDWSLMYTPATESCIQLVRGGVTYNVAIPGRGTIVKFDDNRYYIKADNWAMGEYAPLREDDVLIVSGDFVNSENGYVLSIPTNYIGIYWERPYFYDTMPTEKPAKPVTEKPSASRGAAAKTAKDWTTFEKFAVTKLEKDERGRTPTGIYFRGAENDAPFKEDWTALYSPVDSACVKLIRDGVVYEIGIPGRGTIVKFGSAEFYLKTETWNLGDFMPLQEGDVLVLEGEFESQEEEAVLSIEQTFFFVRGRKVLIEDAAGENAKPMVELLNSAKA